MRILFLCTGNSARSQMAEALLRFKVPSDWEIHSAGTKPKGLNPLAVEAMKEIGIDISHQHSKDVQQFQNVRFDYVITVCDTANETCPIFPDADMIHWSLPDPENLHSFRTVRDELERRIDGFLTGFVTSGTNC
jgi:arsenate reductase (thioredoxin)